MTRKKPAPEKSRISRDEWLARAFQVLVQEGPSKLHIETLVKRLGVTRGSFYWHFGSRQQFVRDLVDYWARYYTEVVVYTIGPMKGAPRERLWALMKLVAERDLSGYDVPVRLWAAQDKQVSRLMKDVFAVRTEFVTSLFRDMGFRGDELEARVLAFVAYMSQEYELYHQTTKKARIARMRKMHAFFTRP
jgi:AcrR family transcriptional regulator